VQPRLLGNYEILEKLGEGGMGEVWRARDERLNRAVAIKILPDSVSGDPNRRARFEREARALAALNHPNIVTVYDVGTYEGRSFIVSELVEGESLRSVLDRGRMPTRRLIDAAVQTADAMAAAHASGIVHRDLKPENIMVTPGGRIKVLDFGLAKLTSERPTQGTVTEALSVTVPGLVMGTAGYMSPEQVRGDAIDHRSDIFSFGAVLYEMITGKRAFHAGSTVETMHAILREDPPEMLSDAEAFPPALGTIVRRCLEKRPEDRFQSAADLAFALRAIVSSTTSGARPSLPVPRVRRWLWPVVAGMTAILLIAAGFLLRDRISSREPPGYQRLTFRSGLVTNARFTSDWRNVIYSANWDGGPGRMYLAAPGIPDSRDLGLPDGSIITGVSSNNEIAFIMGPFTPDGTGTLTRVSISGGQMRPALDGVRWAEWAPDGSTLAVLRHVDGRYTLEYPMGKVLLDNLEFPPFGFRVSPDGNRIAYVHYYKGSSIALSILDKSGKTRIIGPVGGQLSNLIDPFLCWRPDGQEVWYRSFDLKEWGTIFAMDMNGHRRLVTRIPGHATLYDIAPDGRALLRTDIRQEGILGVAPGETTERDLSCLDASELTGISDDGRAIVTTVVGESGGSKGSIYLRKTDGSAPLRVGDGAAWALSPDGKWVSGYSSS
jgi:serine/threonine protein kinase/Tol biopolymer transport system component